MKSYFDHQSLLLISDLVFYKDIINTIYKKKSESQAKTFNFVLDREKIVKIHVHFFVVSGTTR